MQGKRIKLLRANGNNAKIHSPSVNPITPKEVGQDLCPDGGKTTRGKNEILIMILEAQHKRAEMFAIGNEELFKEQPPRFQRRPDS